MMIKINFKVVMYTIGVVLHLVGRCVQIEPLWDTGTLCVFLAFFIPDKTITIGNKKQLNGSGDDSAETSETHNTEPK